MMFRAIGIAAAVACSGKPSPPAQPAGPGAAVADAGAAADAPPLDQDLPRLVERALVMYHAVADALAASGEDCAAATAKLGQLAGTYRDVVVANAKVLHDGRAKQLQTALAPHLEDFDRTAQAIMHGPTIAMCAQNAAFAKAFDELLEAPP
jgi:hypothetical protein